MNTLYLLRHAAPALPEGRSRCLGGRSDPPLSPEGKAAAEALSGFFAARNIRAVGTSPLLRCRETAAALFPNQTIAVLPGMTELDCGNWDGLSFDEIRAKYPAHYARRGEDPSLPPPGGEGFDAAAARALAALREFLAAADGDAVVIAHAGINRALLCALLLKPYAEHREIPQDHLCINLLRFEGALLRTEAVGLDAAAL